MLTSTKKQASVIRAAAAEILESTELPLLLQTVLAIGNHLNSVSFLDNIDNIVDHHCRDTITPSNVTIAAATSFVRTPVRDRSWAMPKHSDSAAFSNLRTTRAPTRNSHCSATLFKPSRLRRLSQRFGRSSLLPSFRFRRLMTWSALWTPSSTPQRCFLNARCSVSINSCWNSCLSEAPHRCAPCAATADFDCDGCDAAQLAWSSPTPLQASADQQDEAVSPLAGFLIEATVSVQQLQAEWRAAKELGLRVPRYFHEQQSTTPNQTMSVLSQFVEMIECERIGL